MDWEAEVTLEASVEVQERGGDGWDWEHDPGMGGGEQILLMRSWTLANPIDRWNAGRSG